MRALTESERLAVVSESKTLANWLRVWADSVPSFGRFVADEEILPRARRISAKLAFYVRYGRDHGIDVVPTMRDAFRAEGLVLAPRRSRSLPYRFMGAPDRVAARVARKIAAVRG